MISFVGTVRKIPVAELVLNLGAGGLYLTLHSHQQNVSRIKMDSGESCFYASLIGRSEVAKTALNSFNPFTAIMSFENDP